jgi:hypothetical protein
MPPLTPSATFISFGSFLDGGALPGLHSLRSFLDGGALPGLHSLRSFLLGLRRFLLLVITVAFRNTEFHEVLQNLFLSDLRRFVAGFLQHRCAAALNLASAQCRKDDKAIFAIDIIWNRNQA